MLQRGVTTPPWSEARESCCPKRPGRTGGVRDSVVRGDVAAHKNLAVHTK